MLGETSAETASKSKSCFFLKWRAMVADRVAENQHSPTAKVCLNVHTSGGHV